MDEDRDFNEYAEYLAGAPRESERFKAFVHEMTEPLRIAQERLRAMREDFDLDTAIGAQLTAIGERVGVSRALPVRLSGVYFSFDNSGVGFDRGKWRGRYDPADGVTVLDDELYRAVIRTRILMNHWDGTRESKAKLIEDALGYFGVDSKVLDLQDTQTMKVVLHMTQEKVPPIVWELFTRRIIDITGAGVGFSVVDNDPWFSFDYQTASVSGFDTGYFFNWSVLNG